MRFRTWCVIFVWFSALWAQCIQFSSWCL